MPEQMEMLNTKGKKEGCATCTKSGKAGGACNNAASGELTYLKRHTMKPVGVLYATREGHTRSIAERVAADLRASGYYADMRNLLDNPASIRLSEYSAVILAASVHAGKHQHEMTTFVQKHRSELRVLPTALLSVTLSQAGAEMPESTPEARNQFSTDVQNIIDNFVEDTGLRPKWVKPVAGAIHYTKYNPLIKFIMKRISRKVGAGTDTSRDYDYTDWKGLDRFIDELARAFSTEAPLTLDGKLAVNQ